MIKKAKGLQRREEALSRERIVEAAIELLDESGEGGLTFRALAERLSTGAGAIYWHIANKNQLLIAACDYTIARTLELPRAVAAPAEIIRAVALGLFDALESHPWIGSAIMLAPGESPMVRILECIGQQISALGVAEDRQWEATSTLLHYILGVGGTNSSNAQIARDHGLDRFEFLSSAAAAWSRLDAHDFPFVRSVAAHLPVHDDRVDFIAGIDLILAGLEFQKNR